MEAKDSPYRDFLLRLFTLYKEENVINPKERKNSISKYWQISFLNSTVKSQV
mgnify:CR=1 FL=1